MFSQLEAMFSQQYRDSSCHSTLRIRELGLLHPTTAPRALLTRLLHDSRVGLCREDDGDRHSLRCVSRPRVLAERGADIMVVQGPYSRQVLYNRKSNVMYDIAHQPDGDRTLSPLVDVKYFLIAREKIKGTPLIRMPDSSSSRRHYVVMLTSLNNMIVIDYCSDVFGFMPTLSSRSRQLVVRFKLDDVLRTTVSGAGLVVVRDYLSTHKIEFKELEWSFYPYQMTAIVPSKVSPGHSYSYYITFDVSTDVVTPYSVLVVPNSASLLSFVLRDGVVVMHTKRDKKRDGGDEMPNLNIYSLESLSPSIVNGVRFGYVNDDLLSRTKPVSCMSITEESYDFMLSTVCSLLTSNNRAPVMRTASRHYRCKWPWSCDPNMKIKISISPLVHVPRDGDDDGDAYRTVRCVSDGDDVKYREYVRSKYLVDGKHYDDRYAPTVNQEQSYALTFVDRFTFKKYIPLAVCDGTVSSCSLVGSGDDVVCYMHEAVDYGPEGMERACRAMSRRDMIHTTVLNDSISHHDSDHRATPRMLNDPMEEMRCASALRILAYDYEDELNVYALLLSTGRLVYVDGVSGHIINWFIIPESLIPHRQYVGTVQMTVDRSNVIIVTIPDVDDDDGDGTMVPAVYYLCLSYFTGGMVDDDGVFAVSRPKSTRSITSNGNQRRRRRNDNDYVDE